MLEKTINEITGYFNKKFPESPNARYLTINSFGKTTSVWFTLSDKYIANIEYNDPIYLRFDIYHNKDESFTLELSPHSRFSIKPDASSYLHSQNVKIPFRKTTGNEDKIIKAMKRYIDHLRDTFDANKDRLINKEQIEERFLNQ